MVRLDVFADIACPWCLVGHRRLQQALAQEPAGSVEVHWRAFQLAPEIPPEGIPRREYYERKFGANADNLHERVNAVGREVGLALDVLKAERAVNTRLAHRAVKLASDRGAAMDALMSAYLEHGVDVGDAATVAELLERRGLAPEDLVTRLQSDEAGDEVDQDIALAQTLGLHAVPAFVADAHFALSGAHEPALLRKLIAAAREQRGARPAA
jgi:predicted DsbA family dithiol-disulfide isomerase